LAKLQEKYGCTKISIDTSIEDEKYKMIKDIEQIKSLISSYTTGIKDLIKNIPEDIDSLVDKLENNVKGDKTYLSKINDRERLELILVSLLSMAGAISIILNKK
jgi:hypothetical protein